MKSRTFGWSHFSQGMDHACASIQSMVQLGSATSHHRSLAKLTVLFDFLCQCKKQSKFSVTPGNAIAPPMNGRKSMGAVATLETPASWASVQMRVAQNSSRAESVEMLLAMARTRDAAGEILCDTSKCFPSIGARANEENLREFKTLRILSVVPLVDFRPGNVRVCAANC